MTAQTCPQNIELEDPLPLFEDRSNQEVKTTTCYMCACRCGIKVTLEGKKARYIQGNRNHPINKGGTLYQRQCWDYEARVYGQVKSASSPNSWHRKR